MMETYHLYIGTYTDDCNSRGVYSVAFDASQETLRLLGASDAGTNPSFLALHGNYIYTANEVADTGRVTAFAIGEDGVSLNQLGIAEASGSFTCHIALQQSRHFLYAANYGSGNIFGQLLTGEGLFAGQTAFCQHEGDGPNKNRQEGPHAHSTGISPDGAYLIAADLGSDELRVYHIEDHGGLELIRAVPTPAGEGPRHFVFHPDKPLLYVLTELHNHVLTYCWAATDGSLDLIDSKSTLPNGYTGESIAADIHLSPDARFLYTSNRGHNSLAVFSLNEDGLPLFLKAFPSGGEFPRNFWVAPGGSHIIVANQESNNIVAFPRNAENGLLGPAVAELSIPKPVCIIHRI